jgi:hypothetical protein
MLKERELEQGSKSAHAEDTSQVLLDVAGGRATLSQVLVLTLAHVAALRGCAATGGYRDRADGGERT